MEIHTENMLRHLINKNGYMEVWSEMLKKPREKFIKFVTKNLQDGFLREMSPAMLGDIMCAFTDQELMLKHAEICKAVCFRGDPAEFLRQLTAFFLAHAIEQYLYAEAFEELVRR